MPGLKIARDVSGAFAPELLLPLLVPDIHTKPGTRAVRFCVLANFVTPPTVTYPSKFYYRKFYYRKFYYQFPRNLGTFRFSLWFLFLNSELPDEKRAVSSHERGSIAVFSLGKETYTGSRGAIAVRAESALARRMHSATRSAITGDVEE